MEATLVSQIEFLIKLLEARVPDSREGHQQRLSLLIGRLGQLLAHLEEGKVIQFAQEVGDLPIHKFYLGRLDSEDASSFAVQTDLLQTVWSGVEHGALLIREQMSTAKTGQSLLWV
jgi:hypothetical protein